MKIKQITYITRLRQILSVLIKYGFSTIVNKIRYRYLIPASREDPKYKKYSDPEKVRMMFEELGGSFIKLGQLLSMRPDLIPNEYSEEFQKLTDHVKPFPFSEAKKIIEEQLNKPIKKVFKTIDPIPLASASISQVHKAVLFNGQQVAVKVQRPQIDEVFKADIHLLKSLAKKINQYLKPEIFNPEEIMEEFEEYTLHELDFFREAKNIQRFCDEYKGSKDVKIPTVHWDQSSLKVLTMEYIDGQNFSKLISKKQYSKKVASQFNAAILDQVFVKGFFHADPHPGNLMLMHDGRIAFIDFGTVGHLDDDLKNALSTFFVAVINRDLETLTNSFIDLGLIDPETEMSTLKDDIYDEIGEYHDSDLKNVNMSILFQKIIFLAKKHKIKLPKNLILLSKCVVTTEGVAMQLNPKFNSAEEFEPFVLKVTESKLKPKNLFRSLKLTTEGIKNYFASLPKTSRSLLGKLAGAENKLYDIERNLGDLTTEIDRTGNILAMSFLLAAILVSSSLLVNIGVQTRLGISVLSSVGFSIALLIFLYLFISILREKR